jgi:uncharacterized protein (TIGR03435 family)
MLCVAFAQDVKQLPSFEVASIKRSPPPKVEGTITMTARDEGTGLIMYENMSLKVLLQAAFRLKDYQIDGPGWLDDERYDINARTADDTPYAQRRKMLQRLFIERLNLSYHLVKRDLPAYVIVPGKTRPTLKTAQDRHPDEQGVMSTSTVGLGQLDGKNQTLQELADLLAIVLKAPVVDQTGIQGEYDLVLDWRENLASDGAELDGLVVAAFQKATGLVLKKHKAPLDVLVIDHLDKVPSEN